MLTSLLTFAAQLVDARSAEEAATLSAEYCQSLPTVSAALVLEASSGSLALRWLAAKGAEASPKLLLRIEHGFREWLAGVPPPPDAMTGFPPPEAFGIKSEAGAPPIHLYTDQASSGSGRAMLLLGIIRAPTAGEETGDEPMLVAARDLLRLWNRPREAELQESEPIKTGRGGRFRRDEILTRSERMESIFRKLDRVVELDVPVLIMGETGTGKELIARAMHLSSNRARRRFYAQNCGAISEGLLESELFGHLRGAFTGAERDKQGLFEIASGSTLFLDEIGEMNLEMQKKLLRVLAEGEVQPIGATEPRKVDVRIVCATNRNLREEVAAGRFREDLYFRLQVIQVTLPPLRDRKEDIPLLCDHFLGKVATQYKATKKTLDRRDPRVLKSFMEHQWPGNIRELENAVTRLAHYPGEVITFDVLKDDAQFISELEGPTVSLRPVRPLDDVLDEVEKSEIENALRHTRGNRTRAADLLRVNRRSLLRRLKKYGFNEADDNSDD
jgi:DNA-binding NtrC family response regulator